MRITHIKDLDMRMYGGRPRRFALYLCPVCGKEFEHCAGNIARTKSCGCERNVRPIKHGDAKKVNKSEHTKLYTTFMSMHQRCTNPKSCRFSRYGGRGIVVCESWGDYENFKQWALSSGYDDGLQIDRIDNDGNYCPSNCRWVTLRENLKNRDLSAVGAHARKLNSEVVEKIRSGGRASYWAEILGVSESLVYKVKRGERWAV